MSAVIKKVLFRPFQGDIQKYPRVLTAITKGAIKPQMTGGCVGNAKSIARSIAGVEGKKWATIANTYPDASIVRTALAKGPCVLNGTGITQEGSSYIGHHAVTLVEMVDEETVLLIDTDDTVQRSGSDVKEFLREANLKDLLSTAKPPMNTDLEGDLQQVDPMVVQPEEGWSPCILM